MAARSRATLEEWKAGRLEAQDPVVPLDTTQQARNVFDREMLDYEADVGCDLFEGSE
jgi:hypothetical protein